MHLTSWISTLLNVILMGAFFVGKKWIESNVEKNVEHKFAKQLADLNSDLRLKESEIAALRDGVLSGRAQRQALMDKRRIEAVEHVWERVGKLAPFEMTSATMARINFDAAGRRTPYEPNLRKLFEMFSNRELFEKQFGNQQKAAFEEQPFLSPLAWAYFSAYQSVVLAAVLKARLLAEGVEEPGKLLKEDSMRDVMKAALPHQSKFIDENNPSSYHFLLEELKDRLLTELKKMLEGTDVDKAAIAQAKEITDAVKRIDDEKAKLDARKIDKDLAVK
jgi:hypothetical protein